MKSSRLFLVANSYVKVVCSEPAKILLINENITTDFAETVGPTTMEVFFATSQLLLKFHTMGSGIS